jgi:cytochrome c biogenesis protein CcmG/thiol:disulfide interchange protein DsbE
LIKNFRYYFLSFFIILILIVLLPLAKNEVRDNKLVLKNLPYFQLKAIKSSKYLNSNQIVSSKNYYLIHLWGSWCAPCIDEMPKIIDLASKSKPDINFYLIATNDTVLNVEKFMSQYDLPRNVTVLVDESERVMELFGTYKVPETFLFKGNNALRKFSGPQNWSDLNLFE